MKLATLLNAGTFGLFALAAKAEYPLKPIPFHEVEMTSEFGAHVGTQRKVLVPFAFGNKPG